MASGGAVLIVEPDAEMRERMGQWFEATGLEVLACPGPSRPDYTCIGGRGLPCALAHAADVVVLDLWLASDMVLSGTSSTDLLSYYLSSGKPVVALSSKSDHTRLFNLFLEEPLFLIESPPEQRELCETVRALIKGGGARDRGQMGMLTRTVVPSPGALWMESSPPSDAARSRRLRSP